MAKTSTAPTAPTTPAATPVSISYTIPATDSSAAYNKFGPMAALEGDKWPLLIGRGGIAYVHKSLDVAKGKSITITITAVE
jgi:hypothetical protein